MIGLALLLSSAAPQWPEDARQVLLWHAERQQEDLLAAPSAAALRDRLYAYQAAGAAEEAWAAARQLEILAPADADGDRYRVQLCLWEPSRWPEGLAAADRWLLTNSARPPQEREAVAAAREVLSQRLTMRGEILRRQAQRSWVPWLALLLVLGGSAFLLRRLR